MTVKTYRDVLQGGRGGSATRVPCVGRFLSEAKRYAMSAQYQALWDMSPVDVVGELGDSVRCGSSCLQIKGAGTFENYVGEKRLA